MSSPTAPSHSVFESPVSGREYQLHSELAQYCLPSRVPDDSRKYAWANSICLLFLVIGLIGLRPPVLQVRQPEAPDEVIATVFEPPPPVPVQQADQPPEENNTATDTPEVQPVFVAAPDVQANFSVPTVGIVAPKGTPLSAPPPVHAAPAPAVSAGPKVFTGMGQSGFPAPDYPYQFRQAGQQGSIVLMVTVDESGAPAGVEVRESSNYRMLDNHVINFVKRRWHWEPGAQRVFLVPFQFKIQ